MNASKKVITFRQLPDADPVANSDSNDADDPLPLSRSASGNEFSPGTRLLMSCSYTPHHLA